MVTVPLYSGKEIDREREKIIKRRRQASEDIALMIKNIEKVLHNRRMIEIYKIMEVRSKKRVQEGVIDFLTGYMWEMDQQVVVPLNKYDVCKK